MKPTLTEANFIKYHISLEATDGVHLIEDDFICATPLAATEHTLSHLADALPEDYEGEIYDLFSPDVERKLDAFFGELLNNPSGKQSKFTYYSPAYGGDSKAATLEVVAQQVV